MTLMEPSYTSRRAALNRIFRGTFGGLAALGLAAPSVCAADATMNAAGVVDGNTIRLSDGSVLRLAGIETPRPDLAPDDPAMGKLAERVRAALARLTGAQAITLRYDQDGDAHWRDRYGRRVGQAYLPDGTWLQQAMVSAGLARVHGDPRHRRDLRDLLAAESTARAAGSGMWRHPAFAIRKAEDPGLGRFADSYQIVAGRVVTAALVKDAGYVNFGPERTSDLTLVLKKSVLAMMDGSLDPVMIAPSMIDSAKLAGRSIRCRGWLELHDGPSITLSHPEQIEILD
jgi:endonuclease YncB( thermonuclease family)